MHDLCLSFFLGITAVPREIESNAYAKFWILGAHKGMGREWEMCKGLLDWRLESGVRSYFLYSAIIALIS